MKTAFLIAAIVLLVPSAGAQSVLLSWPMNPEAVGPGDLDGDGIPDVVTGVGGCVTALSCFNGAQIWQTCALAGPSWTRLAAAGDLDGDGRSEIIVAAPAQSPYPGGPTLILAGATGTIFRTIPTITTFVDGNRDFNGDNIPDQVGVSADGVRVFSGVDGSVLLFVPANACGCTALSPASAVFLNDVDGDGLTDLAVSWLGIFFSTGAIRVVRGPNGAFHSQVVGPGFVGGYVRNAGDLTGDGRDDVTVGDWVLTTFAAYDLSVAGTHPPTSWLWALPSQVLRGAPIGDFTGDGRSDLAITSYATYPNGVAFGETKLVSGATGAVVTVMAGGLGGPGGPGAVGRVGDVNGDGITDFLRSYAISPPQYPDVTLHLEVDSPVTLPSGPVVNLGGGCGSYATLLSAGPLRIAQAWNVGFQTAAPSSSGSIVLDIGPDSPTAFGACTLHVDLTHIASWTVLPVTTNAAGFGGIASILVPSIPSAAGTTVVAQGAIWGTSSPNGFDLSNGILATAGF